MEFTIYFLLTALAVWLCIRYLKEKRLKKEAEEEKARLWEIERQKLFEFFNSKLASIRQANDRITDNINYPSGYYINYKMRVWKDQYRNLYHEINNKPNTNIHLTERDVQSISNFRYNFLEAEKIRDNYNAGFVKKELEIYKTFFDNVEGRKLDLQQRRAIITDEDNNIVIAGAGSGKTTTIVGKVNYIIDRYKVSPEEILLISYTNKSASTLDRRIGIEGIVAKTFHKFGKDIIVSCEGKQPSIFNESQFHPLLIKYFKERTCNKDYLKKVTTYFTDYLKPPKSQFEFQDQGEYIQYLKDQNFRTYKQKEIPKGKTTYRMEVVKSIEECKIANFLLFNNVDYKYEHPYEYDTANVSFRQYKPDFTITQNGIKVYLEHFGISRNGSVPDWFTGDHRSATQKYQDDMQWKRSTHKLYGTTLIESYSYEMNEGILFENLKKNLSSAGIVLVPKTPEEIWEIILTVAKDEVDSFITLFGTFITLMKSNNYSMQDVINRNAQIKDGFLKMRNSLFIDIIKPVYEGYENYLRERNEIDFSDMINKAVFHISNGNYRKKIKYVIIDEFQDISIGRYQLIKAIKSNNPSCRLFCVGDDWQSIYRFSGSDIALFKEFESYFGYTSKSKIETTYRFNDPLITLSSNFIQKNPNQEKKELKGISNTNTTKYEIKYSTSADQDDTYALQDIFNQLLNNDTDIQNKEILILGRYRFDFERIKNERSVFRIDKENELIYYKITTEQGTTKHLKAKFMTVHKAKGLEGEIVIVLNCNSGKFGFPSEMSDDHVLDLLLSEADRYENGEERRLFYVAMTRAKQQVYFVADTSFKSKFIAELEVDSNQLKSEKCPICKTADLILRKSGIAKNGSPYKFYGCSNFLYGCEYTTTEWENNY